MVFRPIAFVVSPTDLEVIWPVRRRKIRRGIVRMYVSRVDDLVWLERGREQPWLLTPEQPDGFIRGRSHQ
jgi:hypothetical protein